MKLFIRHRCIVLALSTLLLITSLVASGTRGEPWVVQAAWQRQGSVDADSVVQIDSAVRYQIIDGFGTCLEGPEGQQRWWQELYYDDLGASILRVDLTPRFASPYAAFTYNSPWFHGNPALPGPDGNNVRAYTGPNDYSALYAGRSAPIAVMGADASQNSAFFDYTDVLPATGGSAAQAGQARAAQLGDFKLIGSIWSPPPWVKMTSGRSYPADAEANRPTAGTPWPFIWGGNFAGGSLDTSDTPLPVFNDGVEDTSALTQFARMTAAYVLGYQRRFAVQFYAISIQNELNFETFYNSALYQHSSDYISALKAVRAEFNTYDELRAIKLIGPEDVLGSDAYGMWTYGGGLPDRVHKNLRHLRDIEADPVAAAALAFYNIHSYAGDTISAADDVPTQWAWWATGWATSPAAGIPPDISGFTTYGKPSWMTETSGEAPAWLSPATGFPGNGAWSIALRIHRALTVGQQSAWLYWQLTNNRLVSDRSLTDSTLRADAPKYVAFKHFARFIRPDAQRVAATVDGGLDLQASAYVHEINQSLTVVLVNSAASGATATVQLPATPTSITSLLVVTSSQDRLWAESTIAVVNNTAQVSVPGYGVTTLYGVSETAPPPAEQVFLPLVTQE